MQKELIMKMSSAYKNFQSESTASGDEFERIVSEDLISKGYTILETNVKISDIGINVDYIAEKDGIKEYG